jgi:hypothetical protein
MNTSFKITTEYGHAFIASRSGNCALGDTLCFYRREIGGIRVLGKNIHLTTYGTMHAECATYLEQFLRVSVEHDDAELNAVAFAVTAAKVKILHDDSQPGGLDVAGAGLQAVLVDGTQGELMAHLRMYAGQPLIVTQTKEGVIAVSLSGHR